MLLLLLLLLCVFPQLPAAKVGPTFGYGYLPGEGFFCGADNGGRGTIGRRRDCHFSGTPTSKS
jgi:hypothetical protein